MLSHLTGGQLRPPTAKELTQDPAVVHCRARARIPKAHPPLPHPGSSRAKLHRHQHTLVADGNRGTRSQELPDAQLLVGGTADTLAGQPDPDPALVVHAPGSKGRTGVRRATLGGMCVIFTGRNGKME